MYTSKKRSNLSAENNHNSTISSARTTQVVLGHSVLIEEVTLEQKISEPIKEDYDISWEEWYSDASDEDSDEEWLESFLLGPKITEIEYFDDICAQLDEATNAIIEEFEDREAFYRQPNKLRHVTFRQHFYSEE